MYSQYLTVLGAVLSLAVPAVHAVACSSTAVTTLSNGHVCTPTCGQDRAGGDYSNVYTGSYSDCLAACGNDSKCATAQYHQISGYCYFKSTVNALVASAMDDTADCCPGVASISSSNRICKTTCGQDRPGGDYSAQYTGNVDACISACGTDSKCATAQYSLSNGYCYLKDSLHDFSSNSNVDSIDCCPGPVVSNGRTCTTTCATDRPGGDYAFSYTGTIDACITACSNDAQCVTAQFHIPTGNCYFKNGSNAAVSSYAVDTVDCSAAPVSKVISA